MDSTIISLFLASFCYNFKMNEKDILDPFSTKKGRLLILLFPTVLLTIFSVSVWKDSSDEPAFYFFLAYSITLGTIMYKFWGEYNEFLLLYRKKINPNYPLNRSELSDFYKKDFNKFKNSYTPITLTLEQHKDKELAHTASKVNRLFLMAASSPLLFFIATVIFYFIRDL